MVYGYAHVHEDMCLYVYTCMSSCMYGALRPFTVDPDYFFCLVNICHSILHFHVYSKNFICMGAGDYQSHV